MNDRTNRILSCVYPDLALRWLKVAQDMRTRYGLEMRLTEGVRSIELQMTYWARGRRQLPSGLWTVVNPKEVITRARPGDSLHHYGLALDACFAGYDPYLEKLPKKDASFLWAEYGRVCQAHGLVWGGDWNGNGIEDKNDFDKPHCEISYGLTLGEIKAIYKAGKLESVWEKIDQLLQEVV